MEGVAHAYVRCPPGNISGVDACMRVKWPVHSHEQTSIICMKRSVICMKKGPVVFVGVFLFFSLALVWAGDSMFVYS